MLRLFMGTTVDSTTTNLNSYKRDLKLFYSFDVSENLDGFNILSLENSQEINKNGTLKFSFLSSHPWTSEIKIYRTFFLLADDDECVFLGFVSEMNKNFFNKIEISCDGYLRVLYYSKFSLSTYDNTYSDTISGYIDLITDSVATMSGTQFLACRLLTRGIINFEDDAIYTYDTSLFARNSVGSFLMDTFIKDLQGFIRIRVDGSKQQYPNNGNYYYYIDHIYLDYSDLLEGFLIYNSDSSLIIDPVDFMEPENKNVLSPHAFKFGVNMFDVVEEYPIDDIYTGVVFTYKVSEDRIYPLSNPYYNREAKVRFGSLVKIVDTSEKYSSAQTAGREARAYADKYLKIRKDKFTITGIDPFFLKNNTQLSYEVQESINDASIIKIGDRVGCYSEPHNINTIMCCLSFTVDYFNFENSTYIIGEYIPDSNIRGELSY